MAGKKVIIRTLDIGADKQIDYFGLDHEDNPALGYRAVRICLSQPEIFRTQLRALLRASAFGNISIMVPMIASVWEVQKVKEMMEGLKAELSAEGLPFKDVEIFESDLDMTKFMNMAALCKCKYAHSWKYTANEECEAFINKYLQIYLND